MRQNLLLMHDEGSVASPACADFWWESEHEWRFLSVLEFGSVLMGMRLPQGWGQGQGQLWC